MDGLEPEVIDHAALIEACHKVLKINDRGTHTAPQADLYPHQWLWDSCFTAIGLRHVDPARAVEELVSLLRGQWSNGMMPNIIFSNEKAYKRDRNVWRSWVSPYAPDHQVATSGITQPPLLAEAVVRVGESLSAEDRRELYHFMYKPLIAYHEWLYADRDPHHEGLTLQIHPYEAGLDNTPPWMNQLLEHNRPWWIAAVKKLHLDGIVNWFRRDTRRIPAEQRMSNADALLLWDTVIRLRRKQYNSMKILHRSLFCTEDLTFNCILIRANQHLQDIATHLRRKLPEELVTNMQRTEHALQGLWDENSGQYYSRDFVTHKLLPEQTIATFMPLYAGCITKTHAAKLVEVLQSHEQFWLHFPVPSVPLSSPYFDPVAYWKGPTWVNTNWLIIDGLERYGYDELAEELRQKTIHMVAKGGINEYFSPINGDGIGAPDFSWTAALTIDLLKHK